MQTWLHLNGVSQALASYGGAEPWYGAKSDDSIKYCEIGTTVIPDDSFVLYVNAYGRAICGGTVGRYRSSYGAKDSEEYRSGPSLETSRC